MKRLGCRETTFFFAHAATKGYPCWTTFFFYTPKNCTGGEEPRSSKRIRDPTYGVPNLLRKRGDSNPRYSYPYDSLANCWFQPLTHPSLCGLIGTRERQFVAKIEKRVHRYCFFFNYANFCAFFFAKLAYLTGIPVIVYTFSPLCTYKRPPTSTFRAGCSVSIRSTSVVVWHAVIYRS